MPLKVPLAAVNEMLALKLSAVDTLSVKTVALKGLNVAMSEMAPLVVKPPNVTAATTVSVMLAVA